MHTKLFCQTTIDLYVVKISAYYNWYILEKQYNSKVKVQNINKNWKLLIQLFTAFL